jgi:hypothetical protein
MFKKNGFFYEYKHMHDHFWTQFAFLSAYLANTKFRYILPHIFQRGEGSVPLRNGVCVRFFGTRCLEWKFQYSPKVVTLNAVEFQYFKYCESDLMVPTTLLI